MKKGWKRFLNVFKDPPDDELENELKEFKKSA